MHIPRPGIRGKILICFAVILAFFLGLTLVMQNESIKLSREYGENLSSYHLVHRFRLNLGSFHALADRYLREPLSVDVEDVYTGIASLNAQYAVLIPLEDVSIPVEFEVRATGYGLDAYLPLVSRAVGLRAGGSPDYYQAFVKATRIEGYIDVYLNRMLSALMQNGEETYAKLSRKSEILNRTVFISMILVSILAVVIIVLVAEAITAPLRRLAKEAEKLAGGDLDAGIVEAHTKDEVETLTHSFATMATSIKEMVEGLKEKAELEKLLHEEELALVSMGKALREAQFMNLQEQMKPHFLFNALNTIARSALLEHAPKTESLSLGLATLLRATIKDSGALSGLDEELTVAQAYLEFQHARFGDRLQWKIDVPSTLLSARVPRLMVQPLVENAVRHALEPKLEGGSVYIKARKRKGKLILWVLDNGIGMSRERLNEIRSNIAASLTSKTYGQGESFAGMNAEIPAIKQELGNENALLEGTGIGLANLATRFAILYGDTCRFEIQSKLDRGTLVRVIIPLGAAIE
ncbi:putative Integral membrane sensor signal transduction histidine kinase [uncultured spirochete]|uniref:histidine kinase n=1 Tax=uncultured spirochete TaxID=156406 RepID=A0A3P3XMU2_9SPIR|nr:putative Integral membrane sensor signal transduction histidine kinase [uncultured spirochete]